MERFRPSDTQSDAAGHAAAGWCAGMRRILRHQVTQCPFAERMTGLFGREQDDCGRRYGVQIVLKRATGRRIQRHLAIFVPFAQDRQGVPDFWVHYRSHRATTTRAWCVSVARPGQ